MHGDSEKLSCDVIDPQAVENDSRGPAQRYLSRAFRT